MSDEHKSGYKSPPIHSRFKKGNQAAKGRRKKAAKPSVPWSVIVEEVLTDLYPVVRGGKESKLPGHEIFKLRLAGFLTKGSPREFVQFMGVVEKHAPALLKEQTQELVIQLVRAPGSTVALPPIDIWEERNDPAP